MAVRMPHPAPGSCGTGSSSRTRRPELTRPTRAARARRYEPHARQLVLPGSDHVGEQCRDGRPRGLVVDAHPSAPVARGRATEAHGPLPLSGSGAIALPPDAAERNGGPLGPPRRGSRFRDGLPDLPGRPEHPADPEPAPPTPDTPVPFRPRKGAGQPHPERRELPDTGPAAEVPAVRGGPATPVDAGEPCPSLPESAGPDRSCGAVGARGDTGCEPHRQTCAAGAPHSSAWVPLPQPPEGGVFAPSSVQEDAEVSSWDGTPSGSGRDSGSGTGAGALVPSPRPPRDDACASRGAVRSRPSPAGEPGAGTLSEAQGSGTSARHSPPGDDGPAPVCAPSGGPGPKAGGPGVRVVVGLGHVCARTRAWRTAQRCALLAEGAGFRLPWRRRPRRGTRCDIGMSTAEYALGTVTAVAFAGVLYVILTGGTVTEVLTDIVVDALNSGM